MDHYQQAIKINNLSLSLILSLSLSITRQHTNVTFDVIGYQSNKITIAVVNQKKKPPQTLLKSVERRVKECFRDLCKLLYLGGESKVDASFMYTVKVGLYLLYSETGVFQY